MDLDRIGVFLCMFHEDLSLRKFEIRIVKFNNVTYFLLIIDF